MRQPSKFTIRHRNFWRRLAIARVLGGHLKTRERFFFGGVLSPIERDELGVCACID
jgi:hypothetical protein